MGKMFPRATIYTFASYITVIVAIEEFAKDIRE